MAKWNETVKNKKKKKFKYISEELIRTYYASYTPDGKIWCSTRNPYEVVGRSQHIEGITYTIIEYYEVTDGDLPWTPTEEVLTDHRTLHYIERVRIENATAHKIECVAKGCDKTLNSKCLCQEPGWEIYNKLGWVCPDHNPA